MTLVLVTGGAGFIGGNTVIELVKRGYAVRVFDDLSTGSLENLAEVKGKFEFIRGDIRSPAALSSAMKDVDVVLHEAAARSIQRSLDDPLSSTDVNVNGTVNVLSAARDAGVKRLIYASSSSVYGDAKTLPLREDMPPSPLSPYAASKYIGEIYCRIFSRLYGMETLSLRYFNVFGPRQDPKSKYAAVVPLFITALLTKKQPVIYGDGKQSRDFTFIGNVVDANIRAIKAKKTGGEVLNIACGETHTVNELYEKLSKLLETKTKPKYAPARLGETRKTQADTTRAKKLLGYKPTHTFEKGLEKTVEWFRNKSY
jgi:UDP-glucose 4-epimerase